MTAPSRPPRTRTPAGGRGSWSSATLTWTATWMPPPRTAGAGTAPRSSGTATVPSTRRSSRRSATTPRRPTSETSTATETSTGCSRASVGDSGECSGTTEPGASPSSGTSRRPPTRRAPSFTTAMAMGDVDMALSDEIADVFVLLRNRNGTPGFFQRGDANGSGAADIWTRSASSCSLRVRRGAGMPGRARRGRHRHH